MDFFEHFPEDINLFKNKALQWAASFETACCFYSNSYPDNYSAFDTLIAIGASSTLEANAGSAFQKLNSFVEQPGWSIGFLGYDLKNEIEPLNSANEDNLKFPDLFFFKPEILLKIKGNRVEISSTNPQITIQEVDKIRLVEKSVQFSSTVKSRFTKFEYIDTVEAIKEHIKRGDIYEMNFCQEFYSNNVNIDPLSLFKALNKLSPTPFASFFKHQDKFIISASPERFISKRDNKLISQPIKGTIRRGLNYEEDNRLKSLLRNDAKEQSENVMIVDLVRNDLTKCSVPGSVRVEELFGIYSFEQVHQMISTVVSFADPQLTNPEIIKHAFPMGSMTGAPKIRAMELIEQFEKSKRGIFSGSIGYFSPDGDFDFNVVIRTILYNATEKYLSFQVGSAITYASIAEKEYEECIVKAEAINKVLSN